MGEKERIAELEGKLEAAYIKGWERAVWLYAVNRDGKLLVGTMGKEYHDVIAKGLNKAVMRMDLEEA